MGKLAGKRLRVFLKIFKMFIHRFSVDQTADLAATLAYYFLLSLFPLAIFMSSLIPYLSLSQKELVTFIGQYVPNEVTMLLNQYLADILRKSVSLLSFGILATIWSASNALNALIRMLNHAYRVRETRSFITIQLLSIALTILLVITFLVTLALTIVSISLIHQLIFYMGWSKVFVPFGSTFSLLINFILLSVIFACLYNFAPNIKLHWREVWAGALFAAAGWQIVACTFSFFVRILGNYSVTYGALGAIIVLMLWFYTSAIILLVGGQLNAMLHQLHSKVGKQF